MIICGLLFVCFFIFFVKLIWKLKWLEIKLNLWRKKKSFRIKNIILINHKKHET